MSNAAARPATGLLSYLADAVDSLPPHTTRCEPDQGGTPSLACDRCILEGIGRELELANEQIQQYRQAGALSALEVMPSEGAVHRAARWMFAREHGSLSSYRHAQLLRGWDENTMPKGHWLDTARELLRAAAGLPA